MTVIVTQSLMSYSATATDNTTQFRDFVSKWTTMFSQSGWVNTDASGSINPSTVSSSTSVGIANARGYQVWAFNDTFHNTGYPVYVRVDYGAPGSSINQGGFWLSAGFMHNGSGSINVSNIDGVGSTPRGGGMAIPGGSAVTLHTHILSCISSSDAVGIMSDSGAGGVASAFAIERTKDANGNSTSEGIVLSYATIQGHANVPAFRSYHMLYSYNSASYVPVAETVPNYILSNAQPFYGIDLTIGMLLPIVSSSFGYPSRMLGFINGSSLTNNASHTLNLFGTSSTYFVSSNTAAQNATMRGRTDTNFRYIIRYE